MDSQWSSDQYFMRGSGLFELPWENHTAENMVGNDDCSEFLNDFEEADFSLMPDYTNGMPVDKSHGFDQALTNSYKADNGLTAVEFEGKSEHSRTTNPEFGAIKSSGSSIAGSDTDGSSSGQQLSSALLCPRLRKPDVASSMQLQLKSAAQGNSHNLPTPTTIPKANQEDVPRLRSSKKTSATAGSNVIGSSLVESKHGVITDPGIRSQLSSALPRVKLKLSDIPCHTVDQSKVIRSNNALWKKNDYSRSKHNSIAPGFAPNTTLRRYGPGKGPEAIIPSSSACSSSSAEAALNDLKYRERRKEHEDLDFQSDDFEEEAVRSKKPSVCRGMDAKRTHAAEVHNLSERRRRDKINEKMHGLRGIVPNCSKVDKASVLDEAIEYIKALQKQVQTFSLQNGVCMPQMVAPSGPRQNHALSMPHLATMGIGMGMGVGLCYGMGVYDINGIPRFSIIPFQAPINGPQFPCSSVSEIGMFGMAGSTNLQMFGMPGMVSSESKPCPPPSGSPDNPVLAAAIALPSHSKDQQQQITQVKDCSEQSPQGSNQTLVDSVNESLNPVSMELESTRLLLTSNSWMAEVNIACEVSSDDDLT